MKRFVNYFLSFFIFVFMISLFTVEAATKLVPLKINGNLVNYRGTNINVMIPSEYNRPDTDFRGVWVTPIVGGNLARFTSKTQYQEEITEVLDIMEYYNLNVLIFHVRPFNDALYQSELNPWSSYLRGYDVDPAWDPLPWIIEETHKRGIEFHAWLNPYRISNSKTNATPESVAAEIPEYNIGSNPEYILVDEARVRAILNPGEPAVRQFLIDTVMELIENYDIDAIHFDDYFYIGNIDDSHTRNKLGYNPNNLNVADWRREQVNIFIEDLSRVMRAYNLANNRYVQLGISPTGIYKNGGKGFAEGGPDNYDANGNFITNGSNTAGQEHYASYLYSDTKKWVDNEWIDYIIPQTYWAFTHTVAGYADVVDWWAKVVRNKNVNLYTGMGIYMAQLGGNYSWGNNYEEAKMQIIYNTKHPLVQGTSIFSYTNMKDAYNRTTDKPVVLQGFEDIKYELWNKKALVPELRTYDAVRLPKVNNLELSSHGDTFRLSWDGVEGAFKYAIYRSTTQNSYTANDLVDVIGHNDEANFIEGDAPGATEYYYTVVPISRTNTLGEPSHISSQDTVDKSVGEITGLVVTGDVFYYSNVALTFDKLKDSSINYEVSISQDLTRWEVLNTEDNPLIDKGTYLELPFVSPGVGNLFYLKVVAYNEEGLTTAIIQEEIGDMPPLKEVTSIVIYGDKYRGETVTVEWNHVATDAFPDVRYILQFSTNLTSFETVYSDYEINGLKVSQAFVVPNKDVFLIRVIAVSDQHSVRTVSEQIMFHSSMHPLKVLELIEQTQKKAIENIIK